MASLQLSAQSVGATRSQPRASRGGQFASQQQAKLLPVARTALSGATPSSRMSRPCVVAAAAAEADAPKKLWGGRFTGATDPLMDKFNESLPFDKRMWAEDIRG